MRVLRMSGNSLTTFSKHYDYSVPRYVLFFFFYLIMNFPQTRLKYRVLFLLRIINNALDFQILCISARKGMRVIGV